MLWNPKKIFKRNCFSLRIVSVFIWIIRFFSAVLNWKCLWHFGKQNKKPEIVDACHVNKCINSKTTYDGYIFTCRVCKCIRTHKHAHPTRATSINFLQCKKISVHLSITEVSAAIAGWWLWRWCCYHPCLHFCCNTVISIAVTLNRGKYIWIKSIYTHTHIYIYIPVWV